MVCVEVPAGRGGGGGAPSENLCASSFVFMSNALQ